MTAYSSSSYSTGSFNIYSYAFEGALYTGFKPVKQFSLSIIQESSKDLNFELEVQLDGGNILQCTN
tara:strand:- start:90 stop:287 length:198 start_codon:yes stop_codon:yes gene_type:complete